VDANANIPKRPDELLSSLGQPVDTSEMQRISQVYHEITNLQRNVKRSVTGIQKVTDKKCMHCNKNPIHVFPKKELRGLSPNFQIHVSVSDLYIPRTSLI
jgi:hypothetical protein